MRKRRRKRLSAYKEQRYKIKLILRRLLARDRLYEQRLYHKQLHHKFSLLLPDAGQGMSVGIHLFVIRQIHDSLFHRQRRTELFQRALFLPAVA